MSKFGGNLNFRSVNLPLLVEVLVALCIGRGLNPSDFLLPLVF